MRMTELHLPRLRYSVSVPSTWLLRLVHRWPMHRRELAPAVPLAGAGWARSAEAVPEDYAVVAMFGTVLAAEVLVLAVGTAAALALAEVGLDLARPS